MKSKYCIVYVTVPGHKPGTSIGKKLVEKNLAACVNIVPEITSVYKWKGKIEKDKEALLIIKTTCDKYKKLEGWLLKNHPYEVPEIICCAIECGSKKYLDWVGKTVSGK